MLPVFEWEVSTSDFIFICLKAWGIFYWMYWRVYNRIQRYWSFDRAWGWMYCLPCTTDSSVRRESVGHFPELLNPRCELRILWNNECRTERDRNSEVTSLSCDLAFSPVNSSRMDDSSEECSGGLVTCLYLKSSDFPCIWKLVFSRVLEMFQARSTGRLADGW